MSYTSEQGLPEDFLNRLLDRVDPHQLHLSPVLLSAMLLCARWVVLRRAHLNMTIKELARRARVDAELIQLLEAGQGHASDLQPAQIESLGKLLAPSRADRAWAQKVVALALGQALPDRELVIKRVGQDIVSWTSAQKTPPIEELVAHLGEKKFAILHVMAELREPYHSYGIAEILFQKLLGTVRFNDATVIALIGQMQTEDLIVKLEELRVDPSVDDQPRPYYRMTALGSQVYQLARAKPSLVMQLIVQRI